VTGAAAPCTDAALAAYWGIYTDIPSHPKAPDLIVTTPAAAGPAFGLPPKFVESE
jgi:hypothetical protein